MRPPPSSLLLTTATADDLDAIMAVMNAAFDPNYGEAWTRAQLASLFVLPRTRLCVAQRGAATAGFFAARCAGPESELLLLAVDPAQRRTGIGGHLLSNWLQWGDDNGISDYFLEMRADNPARTLYEQSGFAECGRRRDYYLGLDGIKRDAITMRRGLAA